MTDCKISEVQLNFDGCGLNLRAVNGDCKDPRLAYAPRFLTLNREFHGPLAKAICLRLELALKSQDLLKRVEAALKDGGSIPSGLAQELTDHVNELA